MTFTAVGARAQYVPEAPSQMRTDSTLVLTLEKAIELALDENVSVKVADLEIKRTEYARRGAYGALFPQINGSASFQRTIKKQVMYMDGMSGGGGSMFEKAFEPLWKAIGELSAGTGVPVTIDGGGSSEGEGEAPASSGGIEVGRLNTFNAGINASMPLVNAQLWQSLSLTGDQVELAVEQARESRLGTVTSVKQSFYSILLAKEALAVYKSVYDNAVENCRLTEMRYNVQKASELDYTRAKANVASAIPNYYNAEGAVLLALWQLKAVMGIDLDTDVDIEGSLEDYAAALEGGLWAGEPEELDGNTTVRQLAIQAEQLAKTIRMRQFAYLPTLAVNFAYSYNAMTNDFNFSEYRWTPYSYVGLSLSIPIFSGGQRYHDVKQARVQAAELDLQRVNTERQLRIGIRQNLQTMETARKTYDAAMEALVSASKAYDIAEQSYGVGKSTLTDLNNTELVLVQSRLAVSQAIFNYLNAKASLEQTVGYDFIDENGKTDLGNKEK